MTRPCSDSRPRAHEPTSILVIAKCPQMLVILVNVLFQDDTIRGSLLLGYLSEGLHFVS